MSLTSLERVDFARAIADDLERSGMSTAELSARTGLKDDDLFDALAATGSERNIDAVLRAISAALETELYAA